MTNQFLHEPYGPSDVGRHVPLWVLGDIRRLGKWLRTCDLGEAEQSHVEDVQQRILDYEIPGYLMETDDVDALRGVFARLNSTGVRMRADEVFQALLGSNKASVKEDRGGFDLALLQEACDLDGFGQPPRREVLKALLAMSGMDPSKRLDHLGEDAAVHLVGASDASDALRRTVAFLQAPTDAEEPGAGIPAYAFIPYPVAFVLLARWFHVFPEPDAATRRELSRWLWRGAATGVHQRAAVSAMRLQVREIRAESMEDSLRRLLGAVGEPDSREWRLEPFHANHAASRVEILALLARAPRDRVGPVSWRALISSGARVAREIVRSASWKELPEQAQRLAHTSANRALLDARNTGLSVEFLRWAWEADREALDSHLIDQAAFADVCGEASGREMARRMGFVIASGNDDAHLKNWSLLWGTRTRPGLAPCSDLVATVFWARRLGWERPGGPQLALRIGGERRFARLDDEVLAAVRKKTGLPWVGDELTAGIVRARDAWTYVSDQVPPTMRAVLDTHWQQVPVLRRVGLGGAA